MIVGKLHAVVSQFFPETEVKIMEPILNNPTGRFSEIPVISVAAANTLKGYIQPSDH